MAAVVASDVQGLGPMVKPAELMDEAADAAVMLLELTGARDVLHRSAFDPVADTYAITLFVHKY